MSLIKIKSALISVFEKDGILEIAHFLFKNGVKIISTGGTYNLLKENNIDAIEISDYTGFPEMMSGRLKTLHPKIHGGLLGRISDESIMKEHNIEKIDLVIVNLYPFEETVKNASSFDAIIEKIDIGGPSMLRSAAKNFDLTTVITSKNDYKTLLEEMKKNDFSTSLDFRKKCAFKVFSLTGFYDGIIAKWFGNILKEEAEVSALPIRKTMQLRYGENPHQNASFYEIPLSINSFNNINKLQGKELSYNNIADADAAVEVTSAFEKPCVSIIKHANPCGIACNDTIESAYIDSLKCDSRSAFGGIVSVNRKFTKGLAELVRTMFYEVIIAPSFEEEAVQILSEKPNLRLLTLDSYKNLPSKMLKNITGGVLIQDVDSNETINEDFELVAGEYERDFEDIIFSFKAVKFFKSNAIVITNKQKVVSFGCGQTSRIDSMEIACRKLNLLDIDRSNLILASDAFFPFTDNLEFALKYGIKTIVAPSGSVKDKAVVEFAKQNNITLFFAKIRHFRH